MSKLRLVKVVVQPTFVLDDGDSLVEQVAEPITVPAKEWPDYPTNGFAEAVQVLEGQLTNGDGPS